MAFNFIFQIKFMIFIFFNDNNNFKLVPFLIILLCHFVKVFIIYNFIIQIKLMFFYFNNNNNSGNNGSGRRNSCHGGEKK